jgi:hypothetical protein
MRFKQYVKLRPEKFGSVLFDTLKEKVFVSNLTGSRILQLIEEDKSREEIVDSLVEEYSASPSQIKTSLDSFLANLSQNSLLEG